MTRYIALDPSSTHCGWVYGENGERRFSGSKEFLGDLADRLVTAEVWMHDLLKGWPYTEFVALETPGGSFVGSVIPQCYLAGVLRLVVEKWNLPIVEVAPKEAKRAFTGNGNAGKMLMMTHAAPLLGYQSGELVIQRGKRFGKPAEKADYYAYSKEGVVLYDEHLADALGVACGAWAKFQNGT